MYLVLCDLCENSAPGALPCLPVDGILQQRDQIPALCPDQPAEPGDPPRVPQQGLRGDLGVQGDELQVPALPGLLEGVVGHLQGNDLRVTIVIRERPKGVFRLTAETIIPNTANLTLSVAGLRPKP